MELPRIVTTISSIISLPRYARTADIGTLILLRRWSISQGPGKVDVTVGDQRGSRVGHVA
jgi:hypothetical protein